MIKLKELNEEYIEWYFNKIKDEVHSRITNCISLFNGTEKIIDNSNFLSLLKFIEINIVNFKDKTSNYLIGNNLKNIICCAEVVCVTTLRVQGFLLCHLWHLRMRLIVILNEGL